MLPPVQLGASGFSRSSRVGSFSSGPGPRWSLFSVNGEITRRAINPVLSRTRVQAHEFL